tara:strand:+ start:135 stop:512 length:378 start_codon:yes stop_codon:yes gene_type:complete
MRTKINRPVVTIDNKRTEASHMHWYDLGYSDAQEDFLDKDSDAYGTAYDNGLEDGRKKEPVSTRNNDHIFDRGWCEGRDSAEIEFVKNGTLNVPMDVLQDKWSLIELQIKGIAHILRKAERNAND